MNYREFFDYFVMAREWYPNISTALNKLNEMLKNDPKNIEARLTRASIKLFYLGKLDKCLKDLNLIISCYPDNPIYLYYRGVAYLRFNELKKAEEDFKKVLELEQDFLPAKLYLARIYLSYLSYGCNFSFIESIFKEIFENKENLNQKLIEKAEKWYKEFLNLKEKLKGK